MIDTELLLSDLQTMERALAKLKRKSDPALAATLEATLEALEAGKPVRQLGDSTLHTQPDVDMRCFRIWLVLSDGLLLFSRPGARGGPGAAAVQSAHRQAAALFE